MLQYFTGSKQHNIALREYAIKKHLSLNEYGIKNAKGNVKKFLMRKILRSNRTFLRSTRTSENRGELDGNLPTLVELSDIKGDLHMHTDYDLSSSHDVGSSTLKNI